MFIAYLYSILSVLQLAVSIPVPNGQLGNVEVECGEENIEAVFLTEAPFQGRIFVIGFANNSNCVSREIGRRTTSIVIDKKECGVVTTRSLDPNGLFSTVKIMISFHPEFITKVDRGYEISCFYMAADKTVTYPITVNTPSLAGVTELAEMPRCRYEVLNPLTNQQAEVVTVGSKLLHKWTCDSSADNLWCMRVHSCRVEDGSGTEFTILDDQGCSVDRYLLDNLEYGPGDLMASKEAHAFKFADKLSFSGKAYIVIVVNFQCSVRLDIKDGPECPIPECVDQAQQSARFTTLRPRGRRPRQAGTANEIDVSQLQQGSVEVDVRAPQIDVIDPEMDFGGSSNDFSSTHLRVRNADCVPTYVTVILATASTFIITLLSMVVCFLLKSRNPHKDQ